MFGISAPITPSLGILVLPNCVLRPWPLHFLTNAYLDLCSSALPCLATSHLSHPGLHLSIWPACDYTNPWSLFCPHTRHLPPRDQALTRKVKVKVA